MRIANANRNRQSQMNGGYSIKIEAEGGVIIQQGVIVPEHSVTEFSVANPNFINPTAFSIYNALHAQGFAVPQIDILTELTRYITNGTQFGGRYIKIFDAKINNGNADFRIYVK